MHGFKVRGVDIVNKAHEESIELLNIVHGICKNKNLKYTISADTLIAYEGEMDFDECIPIIYIATMYDNFKLLRAELCNFCNNNNGYSVHDYANTEQFDSFDLWFVKESKINFQEARKKDGFYYGTRLIITPLFYVGNEETDWKKAYEQFRDTIYTLNARAVLKRKPLHSYIKMTPKRKVVNHYIKQRGNFSVEKMIEEYGLHEPSKYVVYPCMTGRNPRTSDSLPWTITDASKNITDDVWNTVEEVKFYDAVCYVAVHRETIIKCFPDYMVSSVLKKNKSQLLLNGNTYLWRVQQIQIELLEEFDRICRKYGLHYNISFGTLLGAVRHKGFIPWDDDIDVTIPWEDFDKLDEIMKLELDEEKYYFRCPANEENNHLIFKHLERKGTVYTKPGRDKLEHQIGVFIDIFPMYPSAPLAVLDWFHTKICRYWRTALWATVGADSVSDEKKRKYYQKIARPGNKKCYENFVRAATFFKNKKYLKFWIAMDRSPYKVSLVRMSNYTEAIEIDFEGRKFMAPRNYEEVIDYSLGPDWKMYPPTRERVAAHNAIIEIGDLYEKESEGQT